MGKPNELTDESQDLRVSLWFGSGGRVGLLLRPGRVQSVERDVDGRHLRTLLHLNTHALLLLFVTICSRLIQDVYNATYTGCRDIQKFLNSGHRYCVLSNYFDLVN